MTAFMILYSVAIAFTGIATLSVSLRFLLSKEFFPYHAEVTNLKWSDVPNEFRILIIALMRMAGFGILVISLLLLGASVFNFWDSSSIIKFSIPVVGLVFWSGSFTVTFGVFQKTKANTPWQGSLLCVVLLVFSIFVGIF